MFVMLIIVFKVDLAKSDKLLQPCFIADPNIVSNFCIDNNYLIVRLASSIKFTYELKVFDKRKCIKFRFS